MEGYRKVYKRGEDLAFQLLLVTVMHTKVPYSDVSFIPNSLIVSTFFPLPLIDFNFFKDRSYSILSFPRSLVQMQHPKLANYVFESKSYCLSWKKKNTILGTLGTI